MKRRRALDALAAAVLWPCTPPPAWAQSGSGVAASSSVLQGSEGPRALAVLDGGRQLALLAWAEGPQFLGEPLACPHALQGEPQFSPDGRLAYWAAAAGWMVCLDVQRMRWVAERQFEAPVATWALSADGAYLLLALAGQAKATLCDAQLVVQKSWALGSRDGTRESTASSIRVAPTRRSFVLALQALPELWEISFDPRAEDFYEGLVHDFRMAEGVPVRGFLNPRRIRLPEPLSDWWFDAEHTQLVGVADGPGRDRSLLHIVHLDVRRRIATLPLDGEPDPARGLGWLHEGRALLALPNRTLPHIDIIDTRTWTRLRRVPAPAPGLGLTGSEAGPLWVSSGEGVVLGWLDTQAWSVVRWPPGAHAPGGRLRWLASQRRGWLVSPATGGLQGGAAWLQTLDGQGAIDAPNPATPGAWRLGPAWPMRGLLDAYPLPP